MSIQALLVSRKQASKQITHDSSLKQISVSNDGINGYQTGDWNVFIFYVGGRILSV